MTTSTIKPRGLVNLGNTCYFNSIMQVLLNAPLFGPILEERTSPSENKYTLDNPNSDDPVELELPECDYAIKSLVDLYKSYVNNQTRSHPSIAPTKLMSCIRQKTGRFQRLVQEDSHELLRSLLDIIRTDEFGRQKEAINSYFGEKNAAELKGYIFTIIDMIFGGYFLSSVQCQKCKFNSQHFEPFYDLSLAITDPISDTRSAIANFTSNAILDGDNKFICERCSKANGKKTYEAGIKSTKIAVPPNILTLHFKRFEAGGSELSGSRCGLGGGRKANKVVKHNNNNSGKRKVKFKNSADDDDDIGYVSNRGGMNFRKINKHVEFTEFLDLSDFTCDLCYDLTQANKWPRIYRGDPIWYSLFGVVCHSGSLRGGHYTAFVKCEDLDSENLKMEDFASFIQETPYMPGVPDIDKIKELLREHEATKFNATDSCDDEEEDTKPRIKLDCYGQPKSVPGNWYHISDADVRKSSISTVLSSQAYIVFYKRVME